MGDVDIDAGVAGVDLDERPGSFEFELWGYDVLMEELVEYGICLGGGSKSASSKDG